MRHWILTGALATAATLMLSTPALAGPPPLGLNCSGQSDGVRFCQGNGTTQLVPSFDGVPLDVDVTLPSASQGPGPYPTIVMLHGYGGSKADFETLDANGNFKVDPEGSSPDVHHYNNDYFAQRGYAVLNYTTRGFGRSCGAASGATPAQKPSGCFPAGGRGGYIRLADQRYEARDTQYLVGLLADQNVAKPGAIGTTGISYGGGQSIELAYLRDRIRCGASETAGPSPCAGQPNGALVPWISPHRTPLSITAAYPRWPWSDLVSALLPNGHLLDFGAPASSQASLDPFGVPIQSYIAGLFALGETSGFYAPPGTTDDNADLTTDNAIVNAGEPYASNPKAVQLANDIFTYHGGASLPGPAAPLLLESGWNDDLFPPIQSLRLYNSLRAANPAAPVTLQFGDVGHSRGSNKLTVNAAFNDQASSFFDAYLRGQGAPPAPGSVNTFTQTCPSSASGPPDGGPFAASSWPAVHPGVVTLGSAPAQAVLSTGGNPQTAAAFDPIANSNGCKQIAAEESPGTAVYKLPSQGFTLLGLPTLTAHLAVSGASPPDTELVARLWDVDPSGNQRLVTRGVYRPGSADGNPVVFQLHGNGYHFAAGDTVKLELLGRDAPYYRPSNFAFTIAVSSLTLALPTHEPPNGGQIGSPFGNPACASRSTRHAVHRRRPRRHVRRGHRHSARPHGHSARAHVRAHRPRVAPGEACRAPARSATRRHRRTHRRHRHPRHARR